MPRVQTHNVFDLARGIKAFLSLDAGVVRSEAADPTRPEGPEDSENSWNPEVATLRRRVEELSRDLGRREQESARLRARLITSEAETSENGRRGVDPSRIVWTFGSGRTGSSWLNAMLREPEDHVNWGEPLVGKLFADLYYSPTAEQNRDNRHFILSEPTREVWTRSIRTFLLDAVEGRFPEVSEGKYLMATEPNGSTGAPLIMGALPESRMVLLSRDPRDVVASFLDASRKGSWLHNQSGRSESLADSDPDAFVRQRVAAFVEHMGRAKEAYDLHEGPKVLVRYEDLTKDALPEIKRLYTTLGVPFDEDEQARIVHKWSWENMPVKSKGQGKFFRKGQAGGWREDLTRSQVGIVERAAAPLMEIFGYESAKAAPGEAPGGTSGERG